MGDAAEQICSKLDQLSSPQWQPHAWASSSSSSSNLHSIPDPCIRGLSLTSAPPVSLTNTKQTQTHTPASDQLLGRGLCHSAHLTLDHGLVSPSCRREPSALTCQRAVKTGRSQSPGIPGMQAHCTARARAGQGMPSCIDIHRQASWVVPDLELCSLERSVKWLDSTCCRGCHGELVYGQQLDMVLTVPCSSTTATSCSSAAQPALAACSGVRMWHGLQCSWTGSVATCNVCSKPASEKQCQLNTPAEKLMHGGPWRYQSAQSAPGNR